MIKEIVLSSEQALDEYFTALLDEENLLSAETESPQTEEQSFSKEGDDEYDSEGHNESSSKLTVSQPSSNELSSEVSETIHEELQPEVQSEYIPSYTEKVYNEFEVPDLEDVQRLLSQLESTNIVDEPEIDELIGQNNDEIATLVAEEPELAEEVQGWGVTGSKVVVDEPDYIEAKLTEEVQDFVVDKPVDKPEVKVETSCKTDLKAGLQAEAEDTWSMVARHEAFQVLYFDVNSVTFAVPLDELGGIHRKNEQLNHLIGRPDWYLGLQTSLKDQLDVVDTARWVMPEKLIDNSHREKYDYIVMLGESHWGLAANQLMGTEWLDPQKIRWRESAGKRPWLAGMVKEKMCALIHVQELVSMLNAGLDVRALDS